MSNFRPYWMANPDSPNGEEQQQASMIDPFLLDLPTADPAELPAVTLDPLTIRLMRDRDDPVTAHRTRRNTR